MQPQIMEYLKSKHLFATAHNTQTRAHTHSCQSTHMQCPFTAKNPLLQTSVHTQRGDVPNIYLCAQNA